jgi:CheY-like chemotaxis protein
MHSYKNIMVIDDSHFDRLIAQKVIGLSKAAEHVTLMDSALKAIDYLHSADHATEIPDLILLDISMPEMDGFGFLKAFAKLPDAVRKQCKIVMLSSSVNPADIRKAEQSVFVDGFIPKPLSTEKLAAYFERG